MAMLASRLFLADAEALKKVSALECLYEKERFTETFLDTECSSLSNAECILKCDSTAPKYYKFFCFAEDNIMEITTDEKEIREPLSRLTHFHSPDLITRDLLKPFFKIENTVKVYLHHGTALELFSTDYGFAFCRVSHYFLPNKVHFALTAIDAVGIELGFKSLASYEPLDYVIEKKDRSPKAVVTR